LERVRTAKKRIVFTNGCFDILHKGHVSYLSEAKKLGDVLVIGLNTDESVRRLKGPTRPVLPFESRAAVLDSLRMVDFVVPFGEATPIELLKLVRPDVHVKGGDYHAEELPEYETVRSCGGRVAIIPLLPGFSVTSILERIMVLNSKGGTKS